jgi:hypothetical protein
MIEIKCKAENFKLIPIEQIIPNPKNNNRHSIEQINAIAKLIKAHGFREPLTISNRSGFLNCGHARLEAAKILGMKELPVIYQDFASEAEEYQHMTADNEIARWAELDFQGVYDALKEIPDIDTSLLGIEDFKLPEVVEPQCDEDEVPEAPVEPITKLGDIYKLGNHRLMCGDSTSIDAVEKLMDGNKADMVFTDPPYGVSYQSNMRTKSEKFDVIKNDETFISEWINVLPVVSHGWVFVWTSWKVISEWIDICAPIGDMTNMIIWDKGGGGIGDLTGTFSSDYEIALVYNRGAKITGKRLGSVWSVGKDKSIEYVHPTQKPVELGEMALNNCTNYKDNILDLFGGSGSTLIGCEKNNRNGFLMELDPKYCDVIVDRWEKFTGKKAELINGC